MPVTVEALEGAFPVEPAVGELAQFDYDDKLERFIGDVVLQLFRGMSVPDRQKFLWDRLKATFGEDADQVSLILAYAPEEWEESLHRQAG